MWKNADRLSIRAELVRRCTDPPVGANTDDEMAYDQALAARIRDVLHDETRVIEKKMFGGLCFMVGGHMCVGVVGDELMVRVGPDAYDKEVSRKHARPMDFTGKPMKGMVYVAAPGLRTTRELSAWVGRGVKFARSLPKR